MSVERAADGASQRREEEVAAVRLHAGRVPEQLDREVGGEQHHVLIELTCVHGMTAERIEWVVLEDRYDTLGSSHANHLAHHLEPLRDWDVVQHTNGDHHIERFVGKRELLPVVPAEIRLGHRASGVDQHLLRDVDAMELPDT